MIKIMKNVIISHSYPPPTPKKKTKKSVSRNNIPLRPNSFLQIGTLYS